MRKPNPIIERLRILHGLPLALVIAGVSGATVHAEGILLRLDTLGGSYGNAKAVSSDGSTVVGRADTSGDAATHAFRWTSAGITDLGTLGGTNSSASAVSSDGSTVVGTADTPGDAASHAFRWTRAGMTDLGTLGGTYSNADAVSGDGGTVVGDASTAGDAATHAFRWTSAGMTDLGTLGGTYSNADAVSGDGSTVVGDASTAGDAATHAFRWTSAGMTDLGTLGGTNSSAKAVSSDGNVVAGWADTAGAAVTHAFRWTSAGMTDLGTLGGTNSSASAVSSDGSAVVGWSDTAGDVALHAFRWTSAGMTDLGTLGGTNSTAYAISGNGAVVVGRASDSTGSYHAYRWTESTGMQSVVAWLAGAHVTAPTGWHLKNARATNRDGSVVVGDYSIDGGISMAWLARVGGAGSGIINTAAFNQSVIDAGSGAVQIGVNLSALTLTGAHHRTLLDSGLARSVNDTCVWATADAAHFNSSNNDMQLAEVGLCRDIGATRVGLGMGEAWARQGLSLDGRAKYDGQYLIAEADQLFNHGIEGSITGYYGRFDANIKRHYQNGATIDTSTGNAAATSTAVRVRADWMNLAKLGQFTLSPYIAYAWAQAVIDGYTESGGGFPVSYNGSRFTSNEFRAGLAGNTALTGATNLRLATEAVHRLEANTTGTSGQVIGLSSFAVAGQALRQNWVRVSADLDHRLADKRLVTVGSNAGTTGGDPSWGVTVGYRTNF